MFYLMTHSAIYIYDYSKGLIVQHNRERCFTEKRLLGVNSLIIGRNRKINSNKYSTCPIKTEIYIIITFDLVITASSNSPQLLILYPFYCVEVVPIVASEVVEGKKETPCYVSFNVEHISNSGCLIRNTHLCS